MLANEAAFAALPRERRIQALEILRELRLREKRHLLQRMFPDKGPLRRELYRQHLAFFKAGLTHRERLFLAGNRTGKTLGAGGYETALHLTGRYPDWWEGRRFDGPIQAWAAGDTRQTTRDIQQLKLLGPMEDMGSGLIPFDTIRRPHPMPGVPGGIESVQVKHTSGKYSTLGFKSYDQGRESFQGTERWVCWLDEECPEGVYTECLTRTMTVEGLVMLTFTPLKGLTPLILSFLPDGKLPVSD